MQKVKIVRQPKGLNENKPFPGAGEVAEFDDSVAAALVRFKYGELVKDEAPAPSPEPETPAEPEAEKPADKREQATDAKRETREHN